jgi:hypothetical protein
VSAAGLRDFPTSRRPLPQIFDRLVVILAFQAHLFSIVLIVQSLRDYRSVPACLLLWLVSAAVPLACVVAGRRAGGVLSSKALLTATALLLVVDVALPALVPSADRAGSAMWNWGAIGVTLLTFAIFRPARDVLVLAAGHGLIAVAVTATALGQPGVNAFSLLVVANAAVIPALAAAQYLNLYVRAVRLRDRAVTTRRQIETRNAASHAVQEDAAHRLQALQAEVIPLLADVATRRADPGDPQVARTARRLSSALRAELVEGRSGSWLLPSSPSAASGGGPGERWPGIVALDPSRLLGRLRDTDRAALIALLDMLRTHSGWQRVSVALAPGGGHNRGNDHPGAEPSAGPPTVTLTVVAQGPPATAASHDAEVIAAASRLDAEVEVESSTVLVAEARLALAPPSLIVEPDGPHELT